MPGPIRMACTLMRKLTARCRDSAARQSNSEILGVTQEQSMRELSSRSGSLCIAWGHSGA